MKKVPITFLVTGFFYDKGIKYKIGSCSGTRLLCKEVENPSNEIQFSSYSTVEVDDEDAVQILSFLKDIKIRTEGRLQEIKDGIKLLGDQGIKSES